MTTSIKALRTHLEDGTRTYPIFLGYLTAEELMTVAEVPSFAPFSSNADLARNVLNPPIEDWQRPLIEDKWKAIRDTYSKAGEIMPNPVLLAVADEGRVRVTQQSLHGQLTDIYIVEVDPGPSNSRKPLWILDGQHRVKGLSESIRRTNPVPLVLLHGEVTHAYRPEQFAKVFAEVTTYATPLHPIHEDWLQYAFRLDKYRHEAGGSETNAWKATSVAARLCERQLVGTSRVPNPFYNKVQFNPVSSLIPAIAGGFAYTSISLSEIILESYYSRPGSTLGPEVVAEQVALSVLALANVCTTATPDSAFFGDAEHRQKYFQDAYLVGVCTHLLRHGVPGDWRPILEALKFNTSDWNVSGWVHSTGGNFGNTSRKVANEVFQSAFAKGALEVTTDIPLWLGGDEASLTFRASDLSAAGRPRRGGTETTFPINGRKTLNIGSARHLKIANYTVNVGKLNVVDETAPFSQTYTASKLRSGVRLPDAPGSVRLLIEGQYFGGSTSELRLAVSWL